MSHQLETIIGYKFKNPKLLETALTHTSYANESRTPVQHNCLLYTSCYAGHRPQELYRPPGL